MNQHDDTLDITALRAAVSAHGRQRRLPFLSRQLNVSNDALMLFAAGTVELAPDVLQRLAELVKPQP